MISTEFKISNDDVSFFKRTGFLKLKSFFSKEMIEYMIKISSKEVVAPSGNYGAGFSKLKYDIGNDDGYILSMMKNEQFSKTMTILTGKELFFTQGLGFELEKNKSTGFPWHVGTQSFGFQKLEDYGCTIWTPLCKIDANKQRGGMAYIPKDVLSGTFVYQHINMLPALIKSKIDKGEKYGFKDFDALKNNILNSKEMSELLDFYSIEDDFNLGDALIFDKHVMHRSVRLEEGEVNSRLAYALRFSSVDATYDQDRVRSLDYPRRMFNYNVSSEFNEVVCSQNNEVIIGSNYFDSTREARKVKYFQCTEAA